MLRLAATVGFIIVIGVESKGERWLQFMCSDGTEIDLDDVCDGTPHCSDSSDETPKLCHRVTCPVTMFKCAYGACVPRSSRCDGILNCNDGSDEFYCEDENICSEHKFRCSTTPECIPHRLICDGMADCSDGSDEDELVCKDYLCPENTFQCAYGGCVPVELICDRVKDCIDGSDEFNHTCPNLNCIGPECKKHPCSKYDFTCKSGDQCIPLHRVCDGAHQCKDASDETSEVCQNHRCLEGKFRCDYGGCVPWRARCNGLPNCRDWSDENEHSCGPSYRLPEGACRLPLVEPGISYSVLKGCERCRSGDVVPEFTSLLFVCHQKSVLLGRNTVHCQDNQWVPELPTCPSAVNNTIKCPPVGSFGTTIRCEAMLGSNSGWTSCNEPMPVGTRVILECLNFYNRHRGSSRVTCLFDGTWSQLPLTCKPTCGIRMTNSIALIVNGWNVLPEEPVPWHATLFSHENGEWIFFCGGTLISESVVLTAGHCVWKTTPETIKVVLGSNSSDFRLQNKEAQVRSVSDIKLQSAYQDHEGNYGSDLALLILNRPVEINSYVLPACLDLLNKHNIDGRDSEVGMVAGMGVTENDTFSSSLRMTSAKYVNNDLCRAHVKRDFWKYLSYTSFCAGWANGTGVCNGDSGGGFLLQIPKTEIWEIHGIVSLSPRKLGTSFCDPNYFTVFTKISVYIDWIKHILESVSVDENAPVDNHLMPNNNNIVF